MSFYHKSFLFRKIFKYLYKITHSKAYNHNRRYWPYFRIERDQNGFLRKVFYQNQLIANNTYLKTPTNDTCMIVATGPSINHIPKESFQKKNVDYLGLNGAVSLNNARFDYHIIIDYDFITNKFDLVSRILNHPNCILFTTPRCLELILRKYSHKQIRCELKIIEIITENKLERFMDTKVYITKPRPYFYMNENIGFSTEIFDAVYDYYTVAYVALQIAYTLNYKKIFLAGLDMNNFHEPRFYETIENAQPTRLQQDFKAISHAFNVAASFFKNKQIQVFNLSKSSSIDAFTKIDPHI